jgi:NADPH:quinone reductase-like Zn-dependent oxidoreductase/acyl carrier protein
MPTETEPGSWLIFGDRSGIGRLLSEELVARRHYAHVVDPQNTYDFAGLLSGGERVYTGVVYLLALDDENPDEASIWNMDNATFQGSQQALRLVQALAQSPELRLPRLWLITRGVQHLGQENAAVAVKQAPLWGLGQVVVLEHPDLQCVRVDLDPNADAGDAALALTHEICSPGRETQVAFRGGVRHAARLRRIASPREDLLSAPPDNAPFQLVTSRQGVLDNLKLEPRTRRRPGPGEVEIRVHASGLNFRDVLNALGTYPGEAGPLGGECAGVIAAVGEGVHDFRVGDEVVGLAPGCFASYVTTPAVLVAPRPQKLSFEEAASIPVAFLTAFYTLHQLARIRAGERILIHAAAGGVGLAAIQLAQRVGAEVIATAGSDAKRIFLKSLGVHHVFSSRSLDFAESIREATGSQGVDIVLNSLTGEFIPQSLAVLRTGGRFVEIGRIGIWDAQQIARKREDVSYFTVALDRMLIAEPGSLGTLLREIMKEFEGGTLRALPETVFPIRQAVTAFRFMAQARHTGKIILSQQTPSSTEGKLTFRPDGTYVITGGLGGLGLLFAQWLVERGARHLALLGRNEPSASARSAISDIERAGARVKVFRADVSQAESIAAVLQDVSTEMPPVRGVIHSAGVLDDGVLTNQTWPRFAGVMAPKVVGAWSLHTLTRELPLDFFVLFSSTASLLGSPGQANHAAANAFLDALAHHRRTQKLPALSINWGAWSDIGAAARHHVDETIARWGVRPITPEQGLLAFERILGQDNAQVGVIPVEWPKFFRQYAPGGEPLFLSELLREPRVGGQTREGHALLRRLREAPMSQRAALLTECITAEVGKVLGFDRSQSVDPRQPLQELGLDSLMAIELRNSLAGTLGLTLPVPLLFEHPTIESLSAYLVKELALESALPAATSEPVQQISTNADAATGSTAAAAAVEGLSADKMAALLAQELGTLKKRQSS